MSCNRRNKHFAAMEQAEVRVWNRAYRQAATHRGAIKDAPKAARKALDAHRERAFLATPPMSVPRLRRREPHLAALAAALFPSTLMGARL